MKGMNKHRLGIDATSTKLHMKPLALLVSLLATGQAFAVQNGNVTGGAATITKNGATTTIQQTSNSAVIAWNNFDIGQGERVTIQQPYANAAILNRVVGATTATQIQGALDANGRVFIINPNGIVVGKSGTINALAVVLSTLDVSDDRFRGVNDGLGTDLTLTGNGLAGVVRNDGKIATSLGTVLLGSHVVNGATGQITAPVGYVSLVADRSATIHMEPYFPIKVTSTPNGGPQADSLVANDGSITAGLSVLMQAVGANPFVSNTGTVEAKGLAALTADGGTVNASGMVTGQQVNLTAKDVTQAVDASLRASDKITLTTQGQVELNGSSSAGTSFLLGDDNSFDYPDVTLNGAITGVHIGLYANQLNISQHAEMSATGIELNSRGQTNIAGSVTGTALTIRGKGDITQAASGLLHFNAMTVSSPNNIALHGTIDAGSWYSVEPQGQVWRFGAGVYQPGQGFGGANALPALVRGGVITSGTGSITQDGSATNVVQTSDKLVIDWRDFDIAAGESINFLQPNANAAVLNMVSSPNVTTIDGALNANGRVFVLNPYGIVVGTTGTINANSITLVAGMLDSSEKDLLSGDTWNAFTTDFGYGPSSGQVINRGTIATKTGVTLIGSQVMNLTSGRITTGKGNLAMVAGRQVQVSQNADGSMSRVDALTATPNALVANDGRITVDNGYAKLDAYTSTFNQGEIARSLGQIDALNRSGNVSAPGELAAGNILISGRSSNNTSSSTVNIRGRLNGQNVTVHSDGDLYLYGGGTLSTWQRGVDPSAQKVTLEGNRIIVGPEGFNIDGSVVLRGIGFRPIFDQQGRFNVISDDLSLIDIAPLQN
jgi:filamentous hemagglutinin family protein